MTTAAPVAISAAPSAVMRRAPMRTITLDCQEPAAQASAEAVSTRLASPIGSPRVSVSISVRKPLIAKNAADARNAAAGAAGTPRRAVSVPAGTTLRSGSRCDHVRRTRRQADTRGDP
jgi:hypothetical protein